MLVLPDLRAQRGKFDVKALQCEEARHATLMPHPPLVPSGEAGLAWHGEAGERDGQLDWVPRHACIRCVTTAVGTRTRQAATSPQLAAHECWSGCSLPPLSACSFGFIPSYAEKKKAAPGAAPSAVAITPL